MKIQRVFFFFITALLTFFSLNTAIYAQDCGTKDECEKKIREYEAKLTQLRDQKGTLSSQINLMTTQINLTTAKIKNTEYVIEKTGEEIENLSGKITGLTESLDRLSKILLQKIVEGYKSREVTVFDVLLDSENAASLANRIKYIQVAQNNDRVVAFRLQQTKVNFEEQKNLRENKKKQLEALKITLDKQKTELNTQKTQKQSLLTQTNSDERKYQQLLAQALAEFQAIEQALVTGQQIGPVKKGDPIALVGNTGYPGCSTGAHLHFEVRQNGSWVDPYNFLSTHGLRDDQDNKDDTQGRGGWDWPLQDPIIITQHYGHTPWSWRYTYSGGVHTGIDMISRSSDVIRAPADGTLYSSSQNCGGSSVIKIKYIDHGGGVISFFLHVQ